MVDYCINLRGLDQAETTLRTTAGPRLKTVLCGYVPLRWRQIYESTPTILAGSVYQLAGAWTGKGKIARRELQKSIY